MLARLADPLAELPDKVFDELFRPLQVGIFGKLLAVGIALASLRIVVGEILDVIGSPPLLGLEAHLLTYINRIKIYGNELPEFILR